MTCNVCGSGESQHHFGGNSCRACAAFFRRYFNSKKLEIRCTCTKTKKTHSQYPCRSCRVVKCFEVGMNPKKIHGPRDANGSKSAFTKGSSVTIENILTPKSTFTITSTLPKFEKYEEDRRQFLLEPGLLTLFEVTSFTKLDVDLTFKLVSDGFPKINILSIKDRKNLIYNFLLKLWNMDPILDHVANRGNYHDMKEIDIQKLAFLFLEGSFIKGEEMSNGDIWKTFGNYWKQYFGNLVGPICALKLDQTELLAIIWLLFFDHAYINISPSTSDLCWNIRKVILQELRNYELEKNSEEEKAESRFLEILEVPLIVERGERQFHDEILLCEMHKIRMHDDFRAIFRLQRI